MIANVKKNVNRKREMLASHSANVAIACLHVRISECSGCNQISDKMLADTEMCKLLQFGDFFKFI